MYLNSIDEKITLLELIFSCQARHQDGAFHYNIQNHFFKHTHSIFNPVQ